MKNVASLFGKTPRRMRSYTHSVDWPMPNQLIGLEIEAEQTKGSVHPTSDALFPHWRMERDGSLRSGHEYVLTAPLKGDALAKAIQDVFSGGVVFHRTATGSTHIHVDMMEEGTSQDTLKALVLLIYALEPAIFAITDPGREWCGYTNKLTSAPDELVSSILNANEEDYRDLLLLCQNHFNTGRYYGINVQALHKYGSVEFRYFPTATSAEELENWVALTQCFKKAAQEIGGVAGVNRVFSTEETYENFLTTYFGAWKEAIMTEIPQWKARSAIHKALAVASSAAFVKTNGVEPFNEDAIWKNKIIASRFAKKRSKVAAEHNIIWVNVGTTDTPQATSVPAGTIMITNDRLYICDGRYWTRAPFTTNRNNLLTPQIRKRVLAFLRSKTTRYWTEQYRRNIEPNNQGGNMGPLIVAQAVEYLNAAVRLDDALVAQTVAVQQAVPAQPRPVAEEPTRPRPQNIPRNFSYDWANVVPVSEQPYPSNAQDSEDNS